MLGAGTNCSDFDAGTRFMGPPGTPTHETFLTALLLMYLFTIIPELYSDTRGEIDLYSTIGVCETPVAFFLLLFFWYAMLFIKGLCVRETSSL